MSLTVAILMLVGMWLSVAAAMLWGVLRIVRRHSHQHHLPPKMQLSLASLTTHMVRPLLSLLSQHIKMATLSQNQGEHE